MKTLSAPEMTTLVQIVLATGAHKDAILNLALNVGPEKLGPILDQDSTLREILSRRTGDLISNLTQLKGSLDYKPNAEPTKPATPAAPSDLPVNDWTGALPIRSRIVAFLRSHPKSAATAIKEAIGAASGGGFAAALKVGIDKCEIVCHEPGADGTSGLVKVYSAVTAK